MTAREEDLAGAGGASDELLDVVVIGGSQAGLAMAWHLAVSTSRCRRAGRTVITTPPRH